MAYKASNDEVKIATVIATGERFVVQGQTIGATTELSRVHCWGNVTSLKGLSAKHEKSRTFQRSSVKIEDVKRTVGLLSELLKQHVDGLRKQGYVIHETRGGNYRIVSHPQAQTT